MCGPTIGVCTSLFSEKIKSRQPKLFHQLGVLYVSMTWGKRITIVQKAETSLSITNYFIIEYSLLTVESLTGHGTGLVASTAAAVGFEYKYKKRGLSCKPVSNT